MKRWTVAVLGLVSALALGALVASAEEAKDPAGKTLFLTYKCNSCHTIKAIGVEKRVAVEKEGEKADEPATTSKKKVSDLSSLGIDAKADWITKYLKKLEPAKDGKKHLKAFKGTDEELTTLSTWLETMKAEKTEKAEGTPKTEKTEPAAEKEGAK